MPSSSTKERKVKFNTDDMIFRKKSNLSSYFDIEYNSAESLTKTSPEQIVNRILSGRTWINRRDGRIARKNYPDFDSFDTNKNLAILSEINLSHIASFPPLPQEIIEQWIICYMIYYIIYYKCHHQKKQLIKILSGKSPIDIRDTKIARKCYPDFDRFDVNKN